MLFHRLAGAGAFGFVALALGINVALESGSPPHGDAAAAEVAGYFAEHATAVEYGIALTGLAWIGLALFAAGAFVLIGRIERDSGEGWSVVGVIGMAMVLSTFCAVVGLRLALTSGDPATETLWHLHNALFSIHSVSNMLVLIGFSVGGIRTATIRPWHGWLGLTSAGLMAIGVVVGSFNAGAGPAGLSLVGLAGWLLWLAWIATFGLVLLRSGRPRLAVTELAA
jgi:hypothetical protein